MVLDDRVCYSACRSRVLERWFQSHSVKVCAGYCTPVTGGGPGGIPGPPKI